jgi:hypothetical protein
MVCYFLTILIMEVVYQTIVERWFWRGPITHCTGTLDSLTIGKSVAISSC